MISQKISVGHGGAFCSIQLARMLGRSECIIRNAAEGVLKKALVLVIYKVIERGIPK